MPVVGGHAFARVVDRGVGLGVEGLVADVVPARIGVEVYVTRVGHARPDDFRRPFVVVVGGADEALVAGAEAVLQSLEAVGVAPGQLCGGDALLLGGLLHLLPVHVGSGKESDVESVETLEPRERVARDVLVRVPDVRCAVGIGDGRRDVVRTPGAV